MVIPEAELINVITQIFYAYLVELAYNPPLQESPEGFNTICVGIAVYVPVCSGRGIRR